MNILKLAAGIMYVLSTLRSPASAAIPPTDPPSNAPTISQVPSTSPTMSRAPVVAPVAPVPAPVAPVPAPVVAPASAPTPAPLGLYEFILSIAGIVASIFLGLVDLLQGLFGGNGGKKDPKGPKKADGDSLADRFLYGW